MIKSYTSGIGQMKRGEGTILKQDYKEEILEKGGVKEDRGKNTKLEYMEGLVFGLQIKSNLLFVS